jgi:diaminopimelate decarboxylase
MSPHLPFQYKYSSLYCEAVALSAVAETVGTPVYVYSKEELLRRAQAYLGAAAEIPNHLICYAVKANGNPILLRLLAEAGLGADVTSGGELFLALKAGFSPDKILFSGVGKTRHEIEMALEAGIHGLHVESEMELELIGRITTALGKTARITIRVNPDIAAETHPHISTGQQAHKFGVSPEQAMQMMVQAAEHPLLQPVGLAVHIGSQITQLAPFVQAAHFLVELAEETAAFGVKLEYLDVGGGLGIDYNHNEVPEPADWVAAVTTPIREAGYGVVMEPGRSIVGPAGALLTQVIYTKNQGDKRFIIADAGMSDLIRPTLYNAHHPIIPVNQSTNQPITQLPNYQLPNYQLPITNYESTQSTNQPINQFPLADIVGPICETGDTLGKERDLPHLEPGDLLAVLQAGAYGFAMSSNYNGRVKAAEVLIDGDTFHIIRQRQGYEHLLDGVE